MRAEIHPESIRLTSDRIGCDGFRVLIRELPDEGETGTGRQGPPYFSFGYRPFWEKGLTTISFHQDPEHPLPSNRIALILPADQPFVWAWQGAAGKIATFEVHPGFLEQVLRQAGLPSRGLYSLPPRRFAIDRQVDGLCRLLIDETERGGPTGRRYFEHLAAALVMAVALQSDPRLPEAGNLEAQHRRLQRALALMKADFGSKLTLGQLARASGLSAFHFSRLFHRALGMTPHQYLLRLRLHHAQQLLSIVGDERSIGEVAAEAGFADQTHLARHFRRAYGMSPLEFRQAQQK